MRTKDEILCLIEEYRKLGSLRFRLSAIEDKILNDFYSDEFDMQYHDELVLQIKKQKSILIRMVYLKNMHVPLVISKMGMLKP